MDKANLRGLGEGRHCCVFGLCLVGLLVVGMRLSFEFIDGVVVVVVRVVCLW